MKYRVLGKTGLKVSSIGFGSAELGMNYGINVPGKYGKPDKETAKKILHKALDSGINLFDTAPGYGDSESLLGSFISSEKCYIATKINIAKSDNAVVGYIEDAIEKSLKNLKREHIDILQIHNTTFDAGEQEYVLEILANLREKGLVRFIGVSVYGVKDAIAAIKKDFFDVVQIAYSILDQRMLEEVMPEIHKNSIGVISRSAYFRGMLTNKIIYLNDDWRFLKNAVQKIKNRININNWNDLSKLALKFCLSTEGIDSVLIGIHNIDELEFAVETEKEEILSNDILKKLFTLGIKDDYWVEPLNWYRKLV